MAPFTFVNMAIGALGIRYRDFILGTALGMLPGIAAFAFVSERVIDAWREPTRAQHRADRRRDRRFGSASCSAFSTC